MLHFIIALVYVGMLVPFVWTALRAASGKETSFLRWLVSSLVWIGGWLALTVFLIATSVYVEFLWFAEVGYSDRFWKVLQTEWLLFGLALLSTWFALWLIGLALMHLVRNPELSKERRLLITLGAWIFQIVIPVMFGFWAKSNWETALLFLNSVPAGIQDPVFYKDISFYLFELPFWEWIATMLVVFLLMVGAKAFLFALACPDWGKQYDERQFQDTLSAIFPVFIFVVSGLMLTFALQRYLGQFGYLNSAHGAFYGASYVDVNFRILYNNIFIIVLVICAFLPLLGFTARSLNGRIVAVTAPFVFACIAWIILMGIIPALLQKFMVEPNELELERPFIQHNIEFTKIAYGLDRIQERDMDPAVSKEKLAHFAPDELLSQTETLRNIRLADWRALINTLRQHQIFRRYYIFPDVDVDRYIVNGEYRQIMLAPRILDQNLLDPSAKRWVNERLKFTHGYGIVAIGVNEFEDGLPKLIVKNIPPQSDAPELTVTRPEIYFGYQKNVPVIVNSTEDEFDYPLGEANKMTRYQGSAGIPLGAKWSIKRFSLANLFDGIAFYTSDAITPESKILFRRSLEERVPHIAPFLKYDEDPYIVVNSEGRLFWMWDAYTVADRYPYSQPSKGDINYIRNSVKVVVDAYNGEVYFYVFDEKDPVLQVWRKIFPSMFRSWDEMPSDLRAHIRYPDDLFMRQAKMYNLYHMNNPEVFYNKEDVWDIAKERYYDKEQYVEPYFVVMRLPGEAKTEFVSILPLTPLGTKDQPRHNMIAWLTARSDGDHYGDLLVYRFPKHEFTPGTMQVESYIDQDPEMSAAFTLWGQKGSRVIRGHLLVIPIKNYLLYVEPLYLEAETAEIPRLERVIVGLGETVAWGPNLESALANLFLKMGKVEKKVPVPEKHLPSSLQDVDTSLLIKQAANHLDAYLSLMGQGKVREAAEHLESLQKTLEQLRVLAK